MLYFHFNKSDNLDEDLTYWGMESHVFHSNHRIDFYHLKSIQYGALLSINTITIVGVSLCRRYLEAHPRIT